MRESHSSHLPRISRETRRLLIAAALALLLLWLLGRIRYTEGSAALSTVPLLGQLAAPLTFPDLAAEVSLLRARLTPSVVIVSTTSGEGDATRQPDDTFAAVRIDADLAMAWLARPAAATLRDARIVAMDAASGLTLVRVGAEGGVVTPASPVTLNPEEPRYFASTVVWHDRMSLRPTFVAGLEPADDPAWAGPVWRMPANSDLQAGAFVFTMRGDFVGMVARVGDDPAIVPADVLRMDVARLREASVAGGGELGIEVQGLTPPLAAATGASAGAIITRVDPQGPAAQALAIGDVIEAVNGAPLSDVRHWAVYAARVAPAETVVLDIRRGGNVTSATLVATAVLAAPPTDALGLTTQPAIGGGTQVVRIDPGSAADRAGLAPGDIITRAGDVAAPGPAQLRRAFASTPSRGALIIAVTRGSTHRVVALAR